MVLFGRRPGALPQAGITTGLWPSRRGAELDAEAAQMEAVRSLLPRFEAKIQRVLDRVWGNTPEAKP